MQGLLRSWVLWLCPSSIGSLIGRIRVRVLRIEQVKMDRLARRDLIG